MSENAQPAKISERRRRTTAVGGLLREALAPATAKQGVLLAQLLPYWPSICPLLAAHAVPESVRAGTLTVATTTSSVQRELQFLAPSILEGANTILGYTAMHSLKAVVRGEAGSGPKPVKLTKPLPPSKAATDKAAAACQSVGDEALRMVLAKLGAQVLKG
jgi:hypothetical protein